MENVNNKMVAGTSAIQELALLGERTRQYFAASKSAATKRAYRSDWACFTSFCQRNNTNALPTSVATLTLYLSFLAESGKKVSTINRRLAAISEAHQLAGEETPTKSPIVQSVFGGIKRTIGTAQKGKTPLLTVHLREIVRNIPDTPIGERNRALLLLGFAGALRRSELVGLNISDIEMTPEGIIVLIRRSKTDQTGEGVKLGIPRGAFPDSCPVLAVQSWIEMLGESDGPLFRPIRKGGHICEKRLADEVVADVVKKYGSTVGLDTKLLGGHSLRAGLVTQAAASGVSERVIMSHSRHKSVIVVRRYVRHGSLFIENAASNIGL